MKATKQTKPQARKRSAERLPSATPTKPRTRRPGAHDATPARHETNGARTAKSSHPSANAASTAPKAEARPTKDSASSTSATPTSAKAARPAKLVRSVVTNASPRQRRSTSGAEPALRRARRDKASTAPSEVEAKPLSVAKDPSAPPPLASIAEPVETAFGDATEAPPSVDTSASPEATMPTAITAAPPAPLGRRLLKGALQLPLRLLQNASESVGKVRKAYQGSFLHPSNKGTGILGQISRRLTQRTS